MKLDDHFSGLRALRERLGAPEMKFEFNKPLDPFKEIELQLEDGIFDVDLEKDLETVGPFLTYQGNHLAVLYIYDSYADGESLLNSRAGDSTPKFHMAWCSTLADKQRKKTLEVRYVLSRSPTQTFKVYARERDPDMIKKFGGERHEVKNVRLFPCQNCLDELNYKGFAYRANGVRTPKADLLNQVDKFVLKDFLEENGGNLSVMKHLPKTTTESVSPELYEYTKDFAEISNRLRDSVGWKCSKCGIDMTSMKQGLHVHHRDRKKNNNTPSNLQVLCALCHRGIDEFHKTMFVAADIERFIEQNRLQR